MTPDAVHACVFAAIAGASVAAAEPDAHALIRAELDRREAAVQTASPEDTSDRADDQPESDWQVLRVGGEAEAEVTSREMTKNGEKVQYYDAGLVATNEVLPVGYPRPTPPGAIELKKYPSLRRAEFTADAQRGQASNQAFWRLFRHISSNDIAMTAPVEVDLPALSRDHRAKAQAGGDAPGGEPGMTMSFLYRTPELGPTGQAEGGVVVVDTEPMVTLSLGVRGDINDRDPQTTSLKLRELYIWLDEQAGAAEPGELIWVEAGPPRWLGYNGPYIPPARRWWEVQIPVRQVVKSDAAPDAGPVAVPVSGPVAGG